MDSVAGMALAPGGAQALVLARVLVPAAGVEPDAALAADVAQVLAQAVALAQDSVLVQDQAQDAGEGEAVALLRPRALPQESQHELRLRAQAGNQSPLR